MVQLTVCVLYCGLQHHWSPCRYQSGDYAKIIGVFRQNMNTAICGKRLFADRNIIRGWFTANYNVSECVKVCYRIGLPIETPRKKPLKVIDFQGLLIIVAVRTGLTHFTIMLIINKILVKNILMVSYLYHLRLFSSIILCKASICIIAPS